MRKITLLIASLFITIGAMADINQNWASNDNWGTDVSNPSSANGTGNEYFTTFKMKSTLIQVSSESDITVSFTWTGGTSALNIVGVDLLNSAGEVLKSHYEYKHAGGDRQSEVYTLSDVEPGYYNLRYFVGYNTKNQLNATAGNIVVTNANNATALSRAAWSVTPSSEETSKDQGQATNAIDGNDSTFWHTKYSSGTAEEKNYPHWIEFDLKAQTTIYYFDYVSRFDNTTSNGNILNYKLYVSNEAMNGEYTNATLASQGTFIYGSGRNHLIGVSTLVKGRYVALVAESGTAGTWSSNEATTAANCAEFYVYGITDNNSAAKAQLETAINNAQALINQVTIGDGVGEYSGDYTAPQIQSFLSSTQDYYNAITESTPIEDIEEYTDMIEEVIASYTLNMPKAGHYYRLKGISGNYIDASSLYDSNTKQMAMTADENTAGTIFYLDSDAHFLSYVTGTYVKETREIGNINDAKGVWTITESPRKNGKYALRCTATGGNGTDLHDSEGNRADRCSSNCGERHDFVIEEVTGLPVTITAAGYATFYAPVAVEVAEGIVAYAVTINGKWAKLTEIEGGVIPANTGVVLKGSANTYNFAVTSTTANVESDLTGTAAASYITADAYVLTADATSEIGVCFGVATKNQQSNESWLNNSHKAYLPAPANAEGVKSYSFRFDFGGTTGIEEVEVENDVKVIYDLTGRRVNEITEKGIYIVNGSKVLVK